jgi:post-segregation antitoxin (ccd killing protein)
MDIDSPIIPDSLKIQTGSDIISEEARQFQWALDNHKAILAYNEMIKEHGLPLEQYRMF